jgi:hypothetical protein
MTELLLARKKGPNLIFRNLKAKSDIWNAESFGSSGKIMDFEAVIKNKDANLIAYLFWDLKRLGYPINAAFEKFKKLQEEEPDLFFLR